jgi:signal transduction histidine kinase
MVWLLTASSLLAQHPLVLTEDPAAYPLHPRLEVLEDTARAWTIEEVTRPPLQARFAPSQRPVPTFGYSTSAYWLRFTIEADAVLATERWLLEVANKSLDRVSLYLPDTAGGFHAYHTGEAFPFDDRAIPHRNFVFPLSELRAGTQTVYLRVASQGSSLVPLHLWSADAFAQKDRTAHFFLGVFFGGLFIIALYNFFLFVVALRDYTYLLYVLYIVGYIVYQLSVERISFKYVWPESVWWQMRANGTIALCCAVLGLQFSRNFLQTDRVLPRLDRGLVGLMMACGPLIGLNVLSGGNTFVNVLVAVFFIAAATALIIAGGVCLLRGSVMARYYLIAWGMLLGGVLVTMLIYLGVIPYQFWTMRSVQVGSVLEVTLLSLGLGYRYNALQKARERMRLRIASDLHDDIGSGLTQISLYSELAQRHPGAAAAEWNEKMGTLARRLVERMQDIVWAIKPEQETWEGLELRMKDFATGLLAPKAIAFDMQGEVVDEHSALAPNVRQNVLLMFKEVVHNAARHADCTEVAVRWRLTRETLWLQIRDDGCGFDPAAVREGGHGLKSLQRRADEIGARLQVETMPGQGTTIAIAVPLQATWMFGRRVDEQAVLFPRDPMPPSPPRNETIKNPLNG